jgi:hypothetical protein
MMYPDFEGRFRGGSSVRGILILAVVAAFALTTYHHPHWVFASAATQSDNPAQADASHSMESPSSSADPSLFWGDLTPGATEACPHSTDGAHHHSAPGLAGAELFPTPHDCGGFHGDQMMVAALFDTNLPVELRSWPVYLAKR